MGALTVGTVEEDGAQISAQDFGQNQEKTFPASAVPQSIEPLLQESARPQTPPQTPLQTPPQAQPAHDSIHSEKNPFFHPVAAVEGLRSISALSGAGSLGPSKRRPSDRIHLAAPSSLRPTPTSHDGRKDLLKPFQILIIVVRWVCLFVGSLLIATTPAEHTQRTSFVFATMAVWTAFRTVRPIRNWGFQLGTATSVVLELSLAISAVCVTGYWESPLAFLILPGILVGGFSQGGPLVVGYGTFTSVIVTLTASLNGQQQSLQDWRSSGQWGIELMLVALVAGLGHRVLSETLDRETAVLTNMDRLTTANSLLYSLHRVAQSLPESLDLDDVFRSTVDNARELFHPDSVVILLRHETLDAWIVGRADGVRLPAIIGRREAPPVLDLVHRSVIPVRLVELPAEQRATFAETSASGIYVPLRARNSIIGMMALEWNLESEDTNDRADLIRSFAEPAAVAIDNARWFGRIGTVAADEERIRIARDLHDRVGQSLAYIGFELDRLAKVAEGSPLAPQVLQLRTDVRGVVGEVRETLYDLRTDVEKGFIITVQEFLDRVSQRAELKVQFTHRQSVALPFRQEREMWQIAKEAIVNVERHAQATDLHVLWDCNGSSALLEVIDNGRGMTRGEGRTDSYGLRGLYERAGAIGAHLEIHGEQGQGTTVRCRLETL
jgi:signal transduction histidine kinase